MFAGTRRQQPSISRIEMNLLMIITYLFYTNVINYMFN